jgi:hypothetical protein
VKVSRVPVIEGLTIEQLLKYAEGVDKVKAYVPELKEWVHVDRKWLCDIIYTIDTVNFQKHIDECLRKKRKTNEVKKNNNMTGIRAEFVSALANSVVFSSKSNQRCLLTILFNDNDLLIPIVSKGRAA